jgi:hypothetical protein
MVTSARIRSGLGFTVLAAVACGALACSNGVGSSPGSGAGTSAQAVTAAPVAAGAAGAAVAPLTTAVHGHLKAIADALAQVPLRADQRAEIEQLAAAGEARHQAGKTAHAAILAALADQIAAGKVDRAALQPKIDAATAQMLQSRPLDEAAFDRLHTLLEPTQRNAFVDAMESQAQARRENIRHHGAMLREWAADLKLTDAQEEQIHAGLRSQGADHGPGDGPDGPKHDWKAMHDHHKAMLEAFRGEKFAMADFGPPGNAADHADKMGDHFVHIAEVALPILTPEQRGLAAAKLRAKAADPQGDLEP